MYDRRERRLQPGEWQALLDPVNVKRSPLMRPLLTFALETAVRGFNDFRQCGLLRQRSDGVLLLHRMFSSYGHELSQRKRGPPEGGDVMPLTAAPRGS